MQKLFRIYKIANYSSSRAGCRRGLNLMADFLGHWVISLPLVVWSFNNKFFWKDANYSNTFPVQRNLLDRQGFMIYAINILYRQTFLLLTISIVLNSCHILQDFHTKKCENIRVFLVFSFIIKKITNSF